MTVHISIPTLVSAYCALANVSPTTDGIVSLVVCSGVVLAGPALMNTSTLAPPLTTQVTRDRQ